MTKTNDPTPEQLQEYREWRKRKHAEFKLEFAGYELACIAYGLKEQIEDEEHEKTCCKIHFQNRKPKTK